MLPLAVIPQWRYSILPLSCIGFRNSVRRPFHMLVLFATLFATEAARSNARFTMAFLDFNVILPRRC